MGRVSGHVYRVEGKGGRPDRWYASYRFPSGKQRRKCLGPTWDGPGKPREDHYTERMAEDKLGSILTAIRDGEMPDPGVPDRREIVPDAEVGVTFDAAADEYLRFVRDVRRIDERTSDDYRGVIDGYLRDEFGETPIASITPDAIDAYKERLIAEGKLSNRTIVRHLTVLHGIFKRAKRKWELPSNPAARDVIEYPRVDYSGEFDTFDRDEIELLATFAECKRDAALYRVAAYTGLRTGELLGLKWSDVDFVGGLVHVRRSWDYDKHVEKVPKGKRVRSVPMMGEVIDALAGLKQRDHFTADGDLVFCSEVGKHLDYHRHLKRYKASLKRAGLREIRFHDLRHAFGTAAITKLDAYAVQSYMGHAHYSTTQRYLHHQPRPGDAAKIAEAFGSGADRVPNRVPNGAIS